MRRDSSFCAKSVRYNIFTNGASYLSPNRLHESFFWVVGEWCGKAAYQPLRSCLRNSCVVMLALEWSWLWWGSDATNRALIWNCHMFSPAGGRRRLRVLCQASVSDPLFRPQLLRRIRQRRSDDERGWDAYVFFSGTGSVKALRVFNAFAKR